jgi:hypothetical protein
MSGIDSLGTITALRAKRPDCAENLSESGFTILLYPTVFERKNETWRFANKRCLMLYVTFCSPVSTVRCPTVRMPNGRTY